MEVDLYYEALYDWVAEESAEDQLSYVAGDRMSLLTKESDDAGWWTMRHLRSGEEGTVAYNYVLLTCEDAVNIDDDTMELPTGARSTVSGSVLYPDGSEETLGQVTLPDGSSRAVLQETDVDVGARLLLDGTVELSNGALQYPSGAMTTTSGELRMGDGSIVAALWSPPKRGAVDKGEEEKEEDAVDSSEDAEDAEVDDAEAALSITVTSTDFSLGEWVVCDTTSGWHKGVVRFVGGTGFADGEWVGVELLRAFGKNDGSVKGVAYFSCMSKHGIFCRENFVSRAKELERVSVRYYYEALYNWTELTNDEQLVFSEGDTLTLLSKKTMDEGWWQMKHDASGEIGLVAYNYVQLSCSGGRRLDDDDDTLELLSGARSHLQDGSVTYPDGTVKLRDEDDTALLEDVPEGAVVLSDGVVQMLDGSLQYPSGAVTTVDGKLRQVDGTLSSPEWPVPEYRLLEVE